jgi:hypothetical protein
MSSRAFAVGTHGSGREVSFRYRDVVPTGWDPVGLSKVGVMPGATEASTDADAEGAVDPAGLREGPGSPAEAEADAETEEPGTDAQEAVARRASTAARLPWRSVLRRLARLSGFIA